MKRWEIKDLKLLFLFGYVICFILDNMQNPNLLKKIAQLIIPRSQRTVNEPRAGDWDTSTGDLNSGNDEKWKNQSSTAALENNCGRSSNLPTISRLVKVMAAGGRGGTHSLTRA